jgi:leucine dehydrogenase
MWSYDDARAAVRDVLRLSRAMTFKAAAAGLPLGGGKGVIMRPADGPLTGARRRAALLDFAETVDDLDGRYLTAEDVGMSSRDMQVISERTPHVTGLSRGRGGSGDPSPATAQGVEEAIRVTLERTLGDATLKGRSIAVVGLGHVGSRLATRLARGGARLTVADIDPAKRELARRLGARWVAPETALLAEVDLVAPCALGGVLDESTVPALRCRAIAGAANNQLADEGIADLLHARGILWAPDFVVNAGGIINIAVELAGAYDPARARRDVRRIGDTLREIYDHVERAGATPLTAAMELARRRISEAALKDGRVAADTART